METMVLIGTEQLATAASSMRQAAHDMQAAANSIQWTLEQQQRFLDDWLQRFQTALAQERIGQRLRPRVFTIEEHVTATADDRGGSPREAGGGMTRDLEANVGDDFP